MKGHNYNLQTNRRYEELDALRGLAALAVVFFHFTMERSEYNTIFKLGTTGVDLFFLISGFVIFMSLQKISTGLEFAINRISRLYPTYWASVTFTFILFFSYSLYRGEGELVHKLVMYLGNLTMFQNYLGIADLDGPYWTLLIEMLFYLFILFLFEKKLLKYIDIIGIVLCSVTVLVTHFFYDITYIRGVIIWLPLLQFLPLFIAGITFYKIYTNKDNVVYRYLIIAFCFFCQIKLFPYAGYSNYFINQTEYSIMLFIHFILFTLFVNNRLKFIANRLTLFLGKISYALYLIHQFVSLTFIIPNFYNKLGLNFWIVTVLIDLPIVIGLATFITYKIEVPFSKKLKEKKLRIIAFPRIRDKNNESHRRSA
jgi:peptidoglycan/LPS O-acetylase OafA/YrhL